MNKDGDITDEEIVAFCENVGIAGKENQLAALAKNLINMVTNKDGKDIEIKHHLLQEVILQITKVLPKNLHPKNNNLI